jgi:O-antigen/teichoic acid export membrane protein
MVAVLFGAEMMPAALPTQIFFGIFTLSFFATPLSMALLVMERTHVYLLLFGVLAVVNVGLDLILIPRYGVTGAIIPVGLVIAVQPLVYLPAVRRTAPDVAIPMKFIARCFAASSPVLLLIPLMRFVNGAASLAAAVVLASTLLLLGFRWARVVGPDEYEVLESIPMPMARRLLSFISS